MFQSLPPILIEHPLDHNLDSREVLCRVKQFAVQRIATPSASSAPYWRKVTHACQTLLTLEWLSTDAWGSILQEHNMSLGKELMTLNLTSTITASTKDKQSILCVGKPARPHMVQSTTTAVYMRTRPVDSAAKWAPPASNPTLRTVVGSMASPLRLAVAFEHMRITVQYDHVKHPACGSLMLTVTDTCAPSSHVSMESTMFNVDPKLYDGLRALVTTRRLQRFSPDALGASVAYNPTVVYSPIQGPLNELAVTHVQGERGIIPPPSQMTSTTIGSHLTTMY